MNFYTFIFISTLTLSGFLQDNVHNSLNNHLLSNYSQSLVRRQSNPNNNGRGNPGKSKTKDKSNPDDPKSENEDIEDENEKLSKYQEDPLEKKPEEDEEEEEEEDNGDVKAYQIKLVEPTYGSMRILNIPLGGQQRIKWEMGTQVGKTKGIAVTLVLHLAGGFSELNYHIVKNFKLGKNGVIWNIDKFLKSTIETPGLRASSSYRLYVHDSSIPYDKSKPNRVRPISIKVNLYNPPNVKLQIDYSRATHILPSLISSILSSLFFIF